MIKLHKTDNLIRQSLYELFQSASSGIYDCVDNIFNTLLSKKKQHLAYRGSFPLHNTKAAKVGK